MRIVHVSPYFNFPDEGPVGGVLLYAYELCKALVEEGHEVAVYTSGTSLRRHRVRVPQESLEKKEGIEVHRFSGFDNLRIPHLFPHLENPIPFPSFTESLSKEYDLIHIHGHEYVTSFLATLTAKRTGIPTVLSILSTAEAFEEFQAVHSLRKILDDTAFAYTVNSAKTVIAPTKQALDVLKKFSPKKIVQIPLGIDLQRFENLDSRSDYVLFLGRLEQTKRPEDFIKAIPRILKEVDANFVVAGSGTQHKYLVNLVENLGIGRHVKFMGWVPYNRVPEVIAGASVVVAPGNAGYSIMEAAAAQKPIISGKLDWNVDSIGKESALFINLGKVENLAEAIIKVLTDHGLAETIAKKAKIHIEKYASWDILSRYFIDIYGKALM
ncbi:MAG: glycosyltransferase family 4 protein [Candidatus Bathyarchaeota archaeon]|nr:glycosyltransferase family 4 protein [Candidatus Bathyarchaeota archaeon]